MSERMSDDIERVLFNEEQLAERVRAMGARITEDYAGSKPLMVCILRGASIFFADLVRSIDLPIEIDFMAVSSYGKAAKSSGIVRIVKDLDTPLRDRDVIIVEDILDSGLTLKYLSANLGSRSPRSCSRTRARPWSPAMSATSAPTSLWWAMGSTMPSAIATFPISASSNLGYTAPSGFAPHPSECNGMAPYRWPTCVWGRPKAPKEFDCERQQTQ